MKKHLYLWLPCVFAMLILVASFCLLHIDGEIYIFSNMEECDELATGIYNDDFIVYADPSADKNLGSLSYADFFAGKCNCEQCTYEIFAYAFLDEVQAQTYYQKAAGKSGDTLNPNFSLVSGIYSTTLTALKGSMVYTVKMPVRDAQYVLQHLASTFSVKIG